MQCAHLQGTLLIYVAAVEDLDVPLIVLRACMPIELPVEYLEVVVLQFASCQTVTDALEISPSCFICAAGQPVLKELRAAALYSDFKFLL